VVIRLIGNDRHETRNVVGRDVGQQGRGCYPLIETGTSHEEPSVRTMAANWP
jgi:hypothetical protein